MDFALHGGILVGKLLPNLVILQQHLTGIAQKQISCRGGAHAAGGSAKQLDTQFRFIPGQILT